MNVATNPARECGDEHVLRGREPLQMGWYEFALTLVEGKTVLDVGCGSGEGLKLLSSQAKKAVGIDLDERLTREDLDIRIMDICHVPDKSFDVVVCIDVVEHVQNDKALVGELVRVARETVFASTPNASLSRTLHPYHVREYTPQEFANLFSPYGGLRMIGGDCSGHGRREIRNPNLYRFLNSLYCRDQTVLLAKIMRRLLLTRVWPHQAIVLTVDHVLPSR